MRKRLYILLLIIFASQILTAQDTLLSEVLDIKNSANVENYFILLKKTRDREKYIEQLREENEKISEKIGIINNYINAINAQLTSTKKSYAKLLVFVYLNKFYSYNTFSFILSARNFNEAYFRYKYIEVITQYIKKLHISIKRLKTELVYQKSTLEKNLKMQNDILQKIEHQRALNQEDLAKLREIDKNRKVYEKFIESLKEYERNQQFIFSEINKSLNNLSQIESPNADSKFESLKGKLPSPLQNAEIVIPYGVHRHSSMKRVKITNNGVDIISESDNAVKAVYAGKVIKVLPLPNYKYAVLLKHGDYFTVYSNLTKVSVKEGSLVLQGQILGYINTGSGNKTTLNFQLWYKTKKLNPENWIKF